MSKTKVTVKASINADAKKVWDYYTNPAHITKWNFADPSWHCPSAENDMRVGGKYKARMEAKDGSFGFDLEAIYTELVLEKKFTYAMADREVNVTFDALAGKTEVTIVFDAENINPIEMQKNGWQAILNNFKKYTEAN
ncbi:MAG TPA: SRPBCC family protein [Bacteroidia bacterium]|nr:SRPBCC family protein [Bacteroidia bacterium]